MKFVRFAGEEGSAQVGVVQSDVYRVIEGHDDLLGLIQQGDEVLRRAGEQAMKTGAIVSPSTVRNLSPIATPPTFRDFYAFEQHVKAGRESRGLEMDPLWYKIPVFYFSNPYNFLGEGEIPMTPGSRRFDFELEVAAVVGRGGRDLTAEQGEDSIIGYAILCDWSGRDIQHEEMRLSMGPVKGKDTATSLGPWFVTKDELEPHRTERGFDRAMSLKVNGTEYARSNWADIYYSFGEMVSYASRGTEVRPGDVIGSGTCGTGCILELSRTHGEDKFAWLKAGDEVLIEIEGLGTQRTTISPSPEPASFRHHGRVQASWT
ncbi:2-keto-4-pentenoate hydratase/2-oxohepta-3-ene-1,7-dioic acid hydratase in catechol pathway [Arthrobacter ginsengisoli]|uniref:2-keto-4-pentenoate hydratase/2-oxohepta-3-ene-1,7-dioic acid hydratase in catechol pathway n=1 Tax=Arthrobacter ginsengisoli TaxID=1356565 RepID=A0ABU1UDL2_9MICC|nr:fumarylacetoacetate hydrolase family protein [Arthrobacter ginsengisoli]MDR7083294.1 2-keto-4-pentenoate hydratase/2-oxohepta-3-ene-1,7-dioic acid hydratase in catechol pathway [Arthrobacter ginsengisoli]